jgi:hypothetical protein
MDEEEEFVLNLQSKFETYISNEWERRTAEGDDDENPVAVDEGLLWEAESLFNRMFDATRGEYEVHVAALDRTGTILGVSRSRFVLYDSMIGVLRNVVSGYRFGHGVIMDGPVGMRNHIEVRLESRPDRHEKLESEFRGLWG